MRRIIGERTEGQSHEHGRREGYTGTVTREWKENGVSDNLTRIKGCVEESM